MRSAGDDRRHTAPRAGPGPAVAAVRGAGPDSAEPDSRAVSDSRGGRPAPVTGCAGGRRGDTVAGSAARRAGTGQGDAQLVDWDGAGYERVSALQRTMARRALAELTVRGDERCLDVGCGDGYVTRLVAVQLPRGSVLGVDPSPRMIEVARAAPVPSGTDVRFTAGDVLDLPFQGEFDLVCSFNALHWVRDQATALHSLRRAVRDDGRLLLRFVCAGPRPSLEDVAMQVSGREPWRARLGEISAPYVHPDPTAYRQLAEGAGLTVRRADVSDEQWDFHDDEAFARWCTVGFAEWTERLAPAEVSGWVDDVVRAYRTIVPESGRFRFQQLTVEAVPAAR